MIHLSPYVCDSQSFLERRQDIAEMILVLGYPVRECGELIFDAQDMGQENFKSDLDVKVTRIKD